MSPFFPQLLHRRRYERHQQTYLHDERDHKQWSAEIHRYETAVEVAGPIGRIRNPDQKFKPPTIVRSERQCGQESCVVVPNCWPVGFGRRGRRNLWIQRSSRLTNTKGGLARGSGGAYVRILYGDLKRRSASWFIPGESQQQEDPEAA